MSSIYRVPPPPTVLERVPWWRRFRNWLHAKRHAWKLTFKGTIEVWWEGGVLRVGFRCSTCGEVFLVRQEGGATTPQFLERNEDRLENMRKQLSNMRTPGFMKNNPP